MKFTCDKIALTDAVNIVQKAVAVRSTLSLLEGILIKAKNNKITLTGNDLEIGIECVIEASIEKEGSIVVNSKLFGEIVRKLSGDVVSIDTNENDVTHIKCGNSKFKINGINALEFPEIPKFDIDFDITVTQKQLKDLVRHTIFAVGTNESKMILTGCLIEALGNNVNMVAVDGFRLALKKISTENEVVSGHLGDVSLVIPSKTLNELTKIIEDSDEIIKIYCSQKNVRFEFNNVILTSRILEGDYIDYKKIIPSDFKTTVKTSVRPLIDAIERASLIITSEVTKSPIVIKILDNELHINCETSAGKVEEFIPIEMTGDEFEIGFNNRYMLEALKAVTGEEITIHFIGPINPCLITPVSGDSFKYIVLPVRLKNEN